MAHSPPLVTIGLPVHNGMPYLPVTVESLLNQTYRNFELVISDNASDDGSSEYCREVAGRDSRVRVVRIETKVGAAVNYNRLVELASGKYFKWAAADDVCGPDFVGRCFEALEQTPEAVVSHPQFDCIGPDGESVDYYHEPDHVRHNGLARRFRGNLRGVHVDVIIFGLIRTDILRQTRLFRYVPDTDRILLAELALRGTIVEVPEKLFFRRLHAKQSWAMHPSRAQHASWIHPQARGKVCPMWSIFREYLSVVAEAPVGLSAKGACLFELAGWAGRNAGQMTSEIQVACKRFAGRLMTGRGRNPEWKRVS